MRELLKRTDSNDSDFLQLVALLDAHLKFRDGDDHAFYAQYNKMINIPNVIVFYADDIAAGCGAFKKFDNSTVEIKRMFVLPHFRGKGIAGKILKELEVWAAAEGNKTAVLETGIKQPEAIRLYEKSGYNRIHNYGQYANVATSVCMSKNLG
jgi:putative acetyltransferase